MDNVPKDFDRYLEATVTSSTRVRQVILVMITTSVVIFVAIWNASNLTSWFHLRKDKVGAVAQWMKLQEKGDEADRYSALLNKLRSGSDLEVERYTALLEREAEARQLFNAMWPRLTREQILEIAKKWRDLDYDNVTAFKLPFFGVVVDFNDVPFFGGFALLMLLLWLRLSLWRHYSNISWVFSTNDRSLLLFAYQYLSMGQVLSVPPPLDAIHRKYMPAKAWVIALFLLPIAVQVVGLVSELTTLDILEPFGARMHGAWLTGMSAIWLVLLIYFTGHCLALRYRLAQEWNVAFRKLDTQRNATPTVSRSTAGEASSLEPATQHGT
jgi:hypothetical protein